MKKCPFCAEQIQDEAIKCRYCGSMLGGAVAPGGDRPADAGLEAEVRTLLAGPGKIAAIRSVRERTRIGLRDAKNYVEAIEAGGRPILPQPGLMPATAGGGHAAFAGLIGWLLVLAAALALLWFMAHRA